MEFVYFTLGPQSLFRPRFFLEPVAFLGCCQRRIHYSTLSFTLCSLSAAVQEVSASSSGRLVVMEIWNYLYGTLWRRDITMNDARLIEAETGLGLLDGVHRIAICYYYADDGFYSTPSLASHHHRHHRLDH